MSTQSPYRRDNYFGESDDQTDGEPTTGHRTVYESQTQRVARHYAHHYLTDHAPAYCGATLNDPPYAPSISQDLDAHDVSALMGLLFDGPGIEGKRDRLALHKENRPIELTDPVCYPPRNSPEGVEGIDGQTRQHASRYNPETGYLNWKETTWVELGRVPWEQLREALSVYASEMELTAEKREYLLNTAKRAKHDPHDTASDLDIFTRAVASMHEKFER